MHQEKEKKGESSIVAGGRSICTLTLAEVQELLLNTHDSGMVVASETYTGSGTADPGDLCSRYCSMLGMSSKATNLAIALANKTSKTGALAGRSPLSAAAACIFMASHLVGEQKTAKEIQQVAGVSDSTIRHAYKLMWNDRNKIISQDMVERGAKPENLPIPS